MGAMESNNAPWELSDEKLLGECAFEAFVGSGPGGQKRHKTNAAVRLTHLPSGIVATAAESRSQVENKSNAIRRLRHKLALEIRRDIADPATYRVPEWMKHYAGLKINEKNPKHPSAVAEVLDVLASVNGSTKDAAAMLGVTTSALVRFLHDDPPLWGKVNQERTKRGMNPLRAS